MGVGVHEEVLGGGGEKNEEGLRLTSMTKWVAHTFPAKPDPLIQAHVIQNKAQATENKHRKQSTCYRNKVHVTENKAHVCRHHISDKTQPYHTSDCSVSFWKSQGRVA